MNKYFEAGRLRALKYWITERESMRIKKERGEPKPWTRNRLMANTRWCNVRRMDDKVSRWLLQHFYKGSDRLTGATLARLINWPDTIEYLYPSGWSRWDSEAVLEKLLARKVTGAKVFTGVYIINGVGGYKGTGKIGVVVRTIDTVHRERDRILENTDSMRATWQSLQTIRGIGPFIAGQIVADLRHVIAGEWGDRDTWAPQGPGSTRGLLWLTGKDNRHSLSRTEFEMLFSHLLPLAHELVPEIWEDRQLEAHDLQDCLCELSKLVRLYRGGSSKGKPGGL